LTSIRHDQINNEPPDRIFQILLIEDSPSDVRLFKELLREWRVPHCFSWVEHGVEALEFLRRSGNYAGGARPDLSSFSTVMAYVEQFWFQVATLPPPELPPLCETNQPQNTGDD